MPKVLVISDSHGLTDELMQVKQRHEQEVNAMIHCGDSELAADSEELKGFYYAKGNCDFEPDMEEEQVVDVEGLRFFVGHGHLLQVKQTLMPIFYRAEETGADVACFGHSHMLGVEKVGDKLVMNPGSCRLPRDREEPTYALVEWTKGERVLTVTYHHMNGLKMDNLEVEMDLGEKK
ncbi:metallophosphoesterase [Salimicrobium halophilum]|uniref:Phosphoesterase n=1 Tax=Salimicrobium halophilum TaxID=86666 RepID=A0A1G8VEJ1_9BACI|nr:metallophosphoesterase [Salimicrobium halophilum]SDJ64516.1 hypothetical protein SAMN04490247_2652 [Salimicrobium halophilum]